jgi:anti-sigma B factor antagonist
MIDTPTGTPFDRATSSITSTTDDGATVVTLAGEIDAALRDQAGEAMVAVVVHNAPVVIDVGAVSFIDSSGLAFLVQLHRLCSESDLPLELLDPSDNLLELIGVLGMGDEFQVRRSASSDLAAGA